MNSIRFSTWPLVSAAVTILSVTAGCEAIPLSQHPLSDETNSEVDAELLGLWDVIYEEKGDKTAKKEGDPQADPAEAKRGDEPAKDEERPPRFGVGRVAGKERLLELVAMQLSEAGEIEIKRMPLHTTKIGKQRFLSMRFDPDAEKSDFLVLRYEVVNENRVLVRVLSKEFITQSIQRGELKGVVKKAAPADPSDPNSEPRKESIRITASVMELREFLEKNEKQTFETKAVWRLQRAGN